MGCLARITGKTIHEEASSRTRSYDLVRTIRIRRYMWLGHILRMDGTRLVKEAVRVQYSKRAPGDRFIDTPQNMSYTKLVELASDREKWKDNGP